MPASPPPARLNSLARAITGLSPMLEAKSFLRAIGSPLVFRKTSSRISNGSRILQPLFTTSTAWFERRLDCGGAGRNGGAETGDNVSGIDRSSKGPADDVEDAVVLFSGCGDRQQD